MPVRIKNKGLPEVLGKAALLLFCLFVILVAGSVILNLRNRDRQKGTIDQVLPPTQAIHEKFQALDFAGGKMRLSLKADHVSVDQAGRQHLEGKVEIVDEEAAGGVRIKAAEIVLDPEKKLARARGEVSLASGSLLVKASEFEYDLKDKVAGAAQVSLKRDSFNLTANRLVYRAGKGQVELEGDVAGEIKLAREPLSLSCSHLAMEADGLVFLAENLKLASGSMSVSAGRARVGLKEDGSNLDFITLESGARTEFKFRAENSEFQEIGLFSDRMYLKTEETGSVVRTPGTFEVEASGNEWRLSGRGEELEFSLGRGLTARSLRAGRFSGGLRDSKNDEFRLAGLQVECDLASGLLNLGGQARAAQQYYELGAANLRFKLKDRSWEAVGFNLEIRPGFFELPALFFKQEKSVYFTGEKLVGRPGNFDLEGRVRAWQAEEFCQAERVKLEGETGRFLLESLTGASWQVEREDGSKQRLELQAERSGLDPGQNRAVLTGKVKLGLGSLRLASDELILVFSGATPGRLSGFEARGRVGLSWKDYRASGRQASLDLAGEQLTLSGEPQLITAGGEKLEADKLTLFLGDDRIRLENRKRERSLTILVRGK